MSPPAQAKLLRVLTDGLVMRIGSSKPRQTDVRLLVATHRDLKQRVAEGLFREDLYYRLAVVPIAIPPLRERREDISELCEVFLLQAARDLKVPLRTISEAAMRALMNYDFPGNIRELKNLIERACILSAGSEIGPGNLPFAAQAVEDTEDSGPAAASAAGGGPLTVEAIAGALPETLDLRALLAALEKAAIQRALKATGGAQAEAARRLGLSRSYLSYKLDKHGIRSSAG
jgi:DNA-binding NtrC family response regulator